MDRRLLVSASVGIGIVVVVVAGILLLRINQQKVSSPLPIDETKGVKEKLPSKTTADYDDPSGFTFSYPDDLSLTKNLDSKASYAQVRLTAKATKGSLAIEVTDSKIASIDSWVASNGQKTEAGRQIKLGELAGYELKTSSGLLTGVLDQGVLFTISVDVLDNEAYWQKVYESILSTFKFVAPETSTTGKVTAGEESGDVVFEEEETEQ